MRHLAKWSSWFVLSTVVACGPPSESGEGSEPGDCSDGADNDSDGDFDCADSGCSGAPVCEGVDAGVGNDGGIVIMETPCMSTSDCASDENCSAARGVCVAAGSECAIAECRDGFATTCDGSVTMDCTAFGASCAEYEDDGTRFSWCDCGMLDGDVSQCIDAHDGVDCVDGFPQLFRCPGGSSCYIDAGESLCACDDTEDGVCAGAECGSDPDCSTCTPSCSGECGSNGCGGECGTCALGLRCSSGSCVTSCARDCSGRTCGDDGCGGSCGTCSGTSTCNTTTGECSSACVPSCAPGQTCGPNGCGGTCGSACPSSRECSDCPSGASCAVDTYDCRCPFFDRVTYAIDASAMDWSNTNHVVVEVRHVAIDGISGEPVSRDVRSSAPTASVSRLGCVPNAVVRRVYSMAGGVTCTFTDTVTTTTIVIPQGTLTAGGCTAPAL